MPIQQRRAFLAAMAATFFTTKGLYAEHLLPSPWMTEGPFYPDKLPLDQDNDLLIINDNITPAVGEVTNLSGRVLNLDGKPVKNATVEIWQCDANQVYLHTSDSRSKASQLDKNFQGFGAFETGTDGGYRFRTIKPVAYPGRPAPHIHYKVKQNGREVLTSQLFIRGFENNQVDHVYLGNDLLNRELVSGVFEKVPDTAVPQWRCQFDIVLGKTPDERDSGQRNRRGPGGPQGGSVGRRRD